MDEKVERKSNLAEISLFLEEQRKSPGLWTFLSGASFLFA